MDWREDSVLVLNRLDRYDFDDGNHCGYSLVDGGCVNVDAAADYVCVAEP